MIRGSQREWGAMPPKLVHPSGERLSSFIRFSEQLLTPRKAEKAEPRERLDLNSGGHAWARTIRHPHPRHLHGADRDLSSLGCCVSPRCPFSPLPPSVPPLPLLYPPSRLPLTFGQEEIENFDLGVRTPGPLLSLTPNLFHLRIPLPLSQPVFYLEAGRCWPHGLQ